VDVYDFGYGQARIPLVSVAKHARIDPGKCSLLLLQQEFAYYGSCSGAGAGENVPYANLLEYFSTVFRLPADNVVMTRNYSTDFSQLGQTAIVVPKISYKEDRFFQDMQTIVSKLATSLPAVQHEPLLSDHVALLDTQLYEKLQSGDELSATDRAKLNAITEYLAIESEFHDDLADNLLQTILHGQWGKMVGDLMEAQNTYMQNYAKAQSQAAQAQAAASNAAMMSMMGTWSSSMSGGVQSSASLLQSQMNILQSMVRLNENTSTLAANLQSEKAVMERTINAFLDGAFAEGVTSTSALAKGRFHKNIANLDELHYEMQKDYRKRFR